MSFIRADKLFKSYSLLQPNDTVVLREVSLDIEKGEFVALVGPSGAGKSTLLHLLGTLDKADSGTIDLQIGSEKLRITELPISELSRIRNKHIGFIFQFHQLLPEFTACENVMMPMLIAGAAMKEAQVKATSLLDSVGMSHRLEHKPSELSGGEQQRVAIARALINDPEILFADEPTGNLDSVNSTSILEILLDIRSKRSLTMIVATHSAEIAASAQRIIQMRDGRIMAAAQA